MRWNKIVIVNNLMSQQLHVVYQTWKLTLTRWNRSNKLRHTRAAVGNPCQSERRSKPPQRNQEVASVRSDSESYRHTPA